MSEKVGRASLRCGTCGNRETMHVYRDSTGEKYSTCPNCETNVRVMLAMITPEALSQLDVSLGP